jgi:hypothetical protein
MDIQQLYSQKKGPHTQSIEGWMGLRASLYMVAKRITSAPGGKQTLVVRPVAIIDRDILHHVV